MQTLTNLVHCKACGYVDDRLRRPVPLPPLPEQARKAGKCSPSPTYPQAQRPQGKLISMGTFTRGFACAPKIVFHLTSNAPYKSGRVIRQNCTIWRAKLGSAQDDGLSFATSGISSRLPRNCTSGAPPNVSESPSRHLASRSNSSSKSSKSYCFIASLAASSWPMRAEFFSTMLGRSSIRWSRRRQGCSASLAAIRE
jgi:hypothetical protein